jgi:hypothetical protein
MAAAAIIAAAVIGWLSTRMVVIAPLIGPGGSTVPDLLAGGAGPIGQAAHGADAIVCGRMRGEEPAAASRARA